ncbi:MAG: hypothetical protein IT381_24260 [Deltaproteobacteria bacterium]|nr:hypothetical protein [Deltaproteobacteria bacterium]
MYLLCVALLTTAAPKAPVKGETLAQKGKLAYDDYEFDKAAAYFQDALKAGIADGRTREQTLLYLAFTLFGLQKNSEAKAQLRSLFKANPGYVLDQKGLLPELARFFEHEQAAYQKELEAEKAVLESHGKPKVVVTVPVETLPTEPAKPVVTSDVVPLYQSAHPAVKLLPFGIGQFANGDPVGGSLFLVGELLLIGANVASAVLDTQARATYASAPTAELERQIWMFYGLRTASGAAAIVLGAVGILDAFLWSPTRGRARYERGLRATFVPIPLRDGAGVASSFTF